MKGLALRAHQGIIPDGQSPEVLQPAKSCAPRSNGAGSGETSVKEAFVPAQFLCVIQLSQQRSTQRQQPSVGFPRPQPSPTGTRAVIPTGQFASRSAGPQNPEHPFDATPGGDEGTPALRTACGRGQMRTNLAPLGVSHVAPRHAFSFRR